MGLAGGMNRRVPDLKRRTRSGPSPAGCWGNLGRCRASTCTTRAVVRIAIIGGFAIPKVGAFIERRGIDDAVGAVSVHGICGVWSLLAMGIFASGYPNIDGMPDMSFVGQFVGMLRVRRARVRLRLPVVEAAVVFGFFRTPPEVEVLGLDLSEIPATPYPGGRPGDRMAQRARLCPPRSPNTKVREEPV